MTTSTCTIERDLRKCRELIEEVTHYVLNVTESLEQPPEMLRSDLKAGIRAEALNSLYASFSKLNRARACVHRALCTTPPDVRDAPDGFEGSLSDD